MARVNEESNDGGSIELVTERLLLRPFRLTDLEDVFAYATDEEYARYLRSAAYTRRDAEEWVAQWVLAHWDRHPRFAFVLDDRVIGGVNLDVDASSGIAELGYAIARDQWGKGLTPEAAQAVVAWGFEAFDLAKVFATADARNGRSLRVIEKLGMRHEATLRSHEIRRGERADIVYYGLLRTEWEASSR